MYNDHRKYELKDINDKLLGRLSMFLPKFFSNLYEDPKIVSLIIKNSKPSEIQRTLLPLFGNNFYENILSSKYIQNNLMYVITLLLKDEINSLENEYNPEKFLNIDSSCGYLLYELRAKDDIQIYIKKIIEEVVEQIDEYSDNICFDFKKINENITDKFNDIKYEIINDDSMRRLSKEQILNEIVERKLGNKFKKQQLNIEFNSKYLKDISPENYFTNEEEDEDDEDIKEYYNSTIFKRKKSLTPYIDKYLTEKINKQKYKKEVLLFYQKDFYIVKNFIDKFIKNLSDNLNIIPYSIKLICKIISILLKKKFPNLLVIKHNAMISRFFFCSLFWPLIQDSRNGALIQNYAISKNTMMNLQVIIDIFVRFIMGKLFVKKDNYYFSPFNQYFIEKIPELKNFMENLLNVNIPKYLEDVLEDNDKNYKFNMAEENNEEGFIHRSICFSMHDLSDIFNNISKSEEDKKVIEENNNFKICLERMCYKGNLNMIEKIKNKEKEDGKLYYFLLSDCLFLNDKIKNLFEIKQISNHFKINEIKEPKNDEEKNKNLIIKMKNFISGLLFNFIILTREDFSKNCSMNINDILNELFVLSKIPNYIVDDTIPTQWYVSSILEIIPKLPKEMTNNNCQKLIEELINEVNLSIKELDFETLSFIHGKLNFTIRRKLSIQSTIDTIKRIDLNEKIESIINYDKFGNDCIPKNVSINDFVIIEDQKKNKKIEIKNTNYISEFIQDFPDFTIYQRLQDIDILEFEKNNSIPTQLLEYFNKINKHLEEDNNYSKEELKEIKEKIYDYIMTKLYDKLFPPEPSIEDNKIYHNSISHSWVESKHFIKERPGSIYNSFLPDVIKYIKLIIKEKSPRKKIENMSNVFNSIQRVIEFNGGKGLLGIDDFIPILTFSLMKAQIYRLNSTIKYTILYNPGKENGLESQQLSQLMVASDFLTNLSYKDLLNITEEEYYDKMRSIKE